MATSGSQTVEQWKRSSIPRGKIKSDNVEQVMPLIQSTTSRILIAKIS